MLVFHSGRLRCFLFLCLLVFQGPAKADWLDHLKQLQQAYPNHIDSYNEHGVTWKDGTHMAIQEDKPHKTWQEKLDSPSFSDQLNQPDYVAGKPKDLASFHPSNDPGRIRYEPFFRKMYGETMEKVKANLTTIYWMPAVFGKKYPLLVTTINGVDKKLAHISTDLEQLISAHPDFRKYVDNPGGTFNWRMIAHTHRLSPHSFGMTIDINSTYSNYWQWDLQKAGKPISEMAALTYRNQIPWEIVLIFEKYGFIWGGKWYHYDTMHFEYRPELMH